MNDQVYRALCGAIRLVLRSPLLGATAVVGGRALIRQARVLTFLRLLRFDGVIDGGANIGEFAHLVRDALPAADLVCVEPLPKAARVLRNAGFRVEEAALWHSAGTLTLSVPGPSSTSATVMNDAPGISVRSLRLDSLLVSGERLLVKLDLQGAEQQALLGLGELLPRVAGFLLEVSLGSGNYRALAELLGEWGFREYATLNELEDQGRVVEADKVFLREAELVRLGLG